MSLNKINNTTKERKNLLVVLIFIILYSISSSYIIYAVPAGPQIMSSTTENGSITGGEGITTAGGSFTTLILNATTQNFRWKAYVGNITGRMVLNDANNYTIYDWALATYTGEVYASRNQSISWDNIQCAIPSTVSSEETYMNHTSSSVDSISNTFNQSKHKSFYVGTLLISANTCNSTATYLNSTNQVVNSTARFQEVLLQDSSKLIYASPIETAVLGFDNNRYNFQMIVAESDRRQTATTYYFFVELI